MPKEVIINILKKFFFHLIFKEIVKHDINFYNYSLQFKEIECNTGRVSRELPKYVKTLLLKF